MNDHGSNICPKGNTSQKVFKVLELYSGIGGMRYALKVAEIPFEIVAAVDINPIVNEIYRYNFGEDKHLQRNVQSLTVTEIESMKVDLLTMSPPCQPFTRNGLKRDAEDSRSDSFLHVLEILSKLRRKPPYLIVENVKGFEDSLTRSSLIKTLEGAGYLFQEFLLSPSDFGIPNSRLRYYLLAELKDASSSTKMGCLKINKFNFYCCPKCLIETESLSKKHCILGHFLEEKAEKYFDNFLIPENVLLKHWLVLDIVDPRSSHSCCFTKAYSHYVQGTGSVLTPFTDPFLSDVFRRVSTSENQDEKLKLLKSLKLRYFTPKEVANIMYFPKNFDFPEHLSTKQRHKALGNSLNVFVVACLFKSLFKVDNNR
ncbi:tRNA (cytosine(38)-C(5))-methyltransferase-like [Uloborus diversus]|uniref:tRNA (cytosine(38)-C(5))-methyltransferase-like n=1 Tax=Uloborus diversus TaxID=327109 RepID=UPI00240A038C|nr:tRNA (cytosine(38)-C(5))-methyltransferase-like [Uloborus diversus]XP_054709517.1 tRNA (cytosine(38)-C(5))-methyltransferase-like [Uloborus diversus]